MQARKQGHYVGYHEEPRNWLPTYKCSTTKSHVYVNKKSQSPSYCDRVLFKNNTCDDVKIVSYEAYHDLLGSDHRPVVLTLEADLGRRSYCDLTYLKQEVGLL